MMEGGGPTPGFGLRDLLDHNPMVGAPRTGSRYFWTTREQALLREHFPAGGVPAALPHLPGRSAKSIYQHAALLGLKAPVTAKLGRPRERWTSTPHFDELIRRTYQSKPEKSAILALARTLGRPRWWVSRRAVALGLIVPRFKAPPWSGDENRILAERAARTPSAIQQALRRAGHSRSQTAIVSQIKRLGLSTDDPDRMSARDLGTVMGVDAKVVTRWIAKGWLRASGGGAAPFSITRRAVRAFVLEHTAAVDLRKVEKDWFIDLLAGRGG